MIWRKTGRSGPRIENDWAWTPRKRIHSFPLECELRDTPAGEAKTADSQAARATQTSRQLFSTCVHVEPHGSRLGQKAGKNAPGRVVEERETHPRSKKKKKANEKRHRLLLVFIHAK